jgi:hypothetical protein
MPIRDATKARDVAERICAWTARWSGWAVATGTLAISGATGVVARQADLELQGRIFQRSDGVLYAYKDGLKYPIQLTGVTDDLVDSVPEAEFSVDRLDQLFAQPDSSAQSPPVPVVGPPLPAFAPAPVPISLPGPYIAVANPNPGDTPLPGGYLMQGKAFDPAAALDQGFGVDRVQVFLEDRDRGGLLLGEARLGLPNLAAAPGSQFALAGWQALVSLPNGVHTLFVYAHSFVSGKESVARVPIRAAAAD